MEAYSLYIHKVSIYSAQPNNTSLCYLLNYLELKKIIQDNTEIAISSKPLIIVLAVSFLLQHCLLGS